MEKILFLDWDGPISNSRTWMMPESVDPVAIRLLNDLTTAGWKTVLSSSIRKNHSGDNAKDSATNFMRSVGFFPQWYGPSWRTDVDYVSRRHLEILNWIVNTELPEDAIFLIVDDEIFPRSVVSRGRMHHIKASADTGIDDRNINEAYLIFRMTDAELEEKFCSEAIE